MLASARPPTRATKPRRAHAHHPRRHIQSPWPSPPPQSPCSRPGSPCRSTSASGELNIQLADTDRRPRKPGPAKRLSPAASSASTLTGRCARSWSAGQDRQGRRGPARADRRIARRDPLPLQAAQRAGRQRHAPEVKAQPARAQVLRVQAQLAQRNAAPPPAATTKAASTAIGSMDIDVFYCAAKQASSGGLRASLSSCSSGETGRWRLRFLPDSVNQQPGYGITANGSATTRRWRPRLPNCWLSASAKAGVQNHAARIHAADQVVHQRLCLPVMAALTEQAHATRDRHRRHLLQSPRPSGPRRLVPAAPGPRG